MPASEPVGKQVIEPNDAPKTDQERWAEAEAKQYDSFVRHFEDEIFPGWLKRIQARPHSMGAKELYEALVIKENYERVADQLRRPRRIRIEREAYEALTK
jgi:hypothetical protein